MLAAVKNLAMFHIDQHQPNNIGKEQRRKLDMQINEGYELACDFFHTYLTDVFIFFVNFI